MFKSTNEIKKDSELEIGVLKAVGYDEQTAIKLIGNGTQIYEFDYFKENYKDIVEDEEYQDDVKKWLILKNHVMNIGWLLDTIIMIMWLV